MNNSCSVCELPVKGYCQCNYNTTPFCDQHLKEHSQKSGIHQTFLVNDSDYLIVKQNLLQFIRSYVEDLHSIKAGLFKTIATLTSLLEKKLEEMVKEIDSIEDAWLETLVTVESNTSSLLQADPRSLKRHINSLERPFVIIRETEFLKILDGMMLLQTGTEPGFLSSKYTIGNSYLASFELPNYKTEVFPLWSTEPLLVLPRIIKSVVDKLPFEKGTYIGEINESSEPAGIGTMFWKDGSISSGVFEKFNLNGLGRYFFADGKVFEGNFKNGKKSGWGVYYHPNGDVKPDKSFKLIRHL